MRLNCINIIGNISKIVLFTNNNLIGSGFMDSMIDRLILADQIESQKQGKV